MPSFQDSAFIIILGLLLFGPKGLASIARQVGKLMGEFRRASADFRMQMEDELRIAEQADQQKKIAAMEAAAPVTPLLHANTPDPEHPHMETATPVDATTPAIVEDLNDRGAENPASTQAPLPIASSGNLDLMPPATGLPIARSSSMSQVFDSIPHASAADANPAFEARGERTEQEATTNG